MFYYSPFFNIKSITDINKTTLFHPREIDKKINIYIRKQKKTKCAVQSLKDFIIIFYLNDSNSNIFIPFTYTKLQEFLNSIEIKDSPNKYISSSVTVIQFFKELYDREQSRMSESFKNPLPYYDSTYVDRQQKKLEEVFTTINNKEFMEAYKNSEENDELDEESSSYNTAGGYLKTKKNKLKHTKKKIKSKRK
jgi:hypothetical protein